MLIPDLIHQWCPSRLGWVCGSSTDGLSDGRAQIDTKYTPYYLAFLLKPRLLVEDILPSAPPAGSTDCDEASQQAAVDRRIEAAVSLLGPQVHKQAQSNIEASQAKQKVYFDAAHAPPKYCIGDLVLVNDARRQQRQGGGGDSGELKPKWSGPHRILKINNKGTYKLEGRKALVNAKIWNWRIFHT